jgi:hypothetical protein
VLSWFPVSATIPFGLPQGKEIAKDFGVAGPEISRLVDAQIDYLVLHPHATVEDCAGLLRTECAKK